MRRPVVYFHDTSTKLGFCSLAHLDAYVRAEEPTDIHTGYVNLSAAISCLNCHWCGVNLGKTYACLLHVDSSCPTYNFSRTYAARRFSESYMILEGGIPPSASSWRRAAALFAEDMTDGDEIAAVVVALEFLV